jgi:4-hydroxyphenylpyruvate dioxygenase
VKTSIATVSLSGDLPTKIAAIADAGFDGLELFESDFTYAEVSASEVRLRLLDAGLQLFALQPFRDFEGLLDAKRGAAFDRAERKFDLMEQLGTDLLLVPSTVSPNAADGIDRYADDFRELGDRASRRGFRVAFEALAWGRHIRDWTQAWEVVKRTDHRSVGLVLDTYHLFVRGNPIAPIRDLPEEKIFMVQLADAPSLDMEVLRHSRHLRNFPGQGDYPIVDFMNELLATGYDDVISHEIFNDDFRVAPATQTATDGYRSMIWLEEQIGLRRRSDPTPTARSLQRWTNRTTPAASALCGISFVEFATSNADEINELSAFFAQLGYRHTHTHQSKQVLLFEQGGTYLALNAEPDSYARSFAEHHGAAACAIGFETTDAQGALTRAVSFLAPQVSGRRQQNEIDMPAIAGVGGSLVYLVDTSKPHFTTTDFKPVPHADRADDSALITPMKFDHVAQALARHELLSVILFYRAVLGFSLQPPQELVDPNGLVTSRVVVSPGGEIRIPLNATSAGETAPERFRSIAHGSGVQHIAIAATSINDVLLRIDPSIVLPISPNYYEDLDARFGLQRELLEHLRKHNILYDRTDSGEFFHLYTQEIHGVFFEFIQRNNYEGFGAANAPVRLAAQSRAQRVSE